MHGFLCVLCTSAGFSFCVAFAQAHACRLQGFRVVFSEVELCDYEAVKAGVSEAKNPLSFEGLSFSHLLAIISQAARRMLLTVLCVSLRRTLCSLLYFP